MKIRTSYVCHPGKKRRNNQDNLYYQGRILRKDHKKKCSWLSAKWNTSELLCFGVFDGMGGEQCGELASYLAADAVRKTLHGNTENKLLSDLFYDICRKANTEIYQKTVELGVERIGTTAAMVMLQYDTIWCCNVGDSRIYRLRNGELVQLSMDHVAAVREGSGKKPALSAHLGMSPQEMFPNPYLMNLEIRSGDWYLLCSDGVTDMIPEERIRTILTETKLKKASRCLLKEALRQGGFDNATLVLIQVLEERNCSKWM